MDLKILKPIIQFYLKRSWCEKLLLLDLTAPKVIKDDLYRSPYPIIEMDAKVKMMDGNLTKNWHLVQKISSVLNFKREKFFYEFVAPGYRQEKLVVSDNLNYLEEYFSPDYYGSVSIREDPKINQNNDLASESGCLILKNLKAEGYYLLHF